VDKRLIGRKFGGNSGSLPGFGKATTFASFQDVGVTSLSSLGPISGTDCAISRPRSESGARQWENYDYHHLP
jgi:hypothetical protein